MTVAILCVALGAGCTHISRSKSSGEFLFPLVKPEHECMQALLRNAMGCMDPEHGLVDPASGYPVEGWNQDSEWALYLRSFTQLTAMGARLEMLANIAAGYADNPYVSRREALMQLQQMTANLLHDQADPAVGAKGLLSNFLGFGPNGRQGPLSDEVERQRFTDTFGAEQGGRIWEALISKQWIIPQRDGSFAKVPRKGDYGDQFFTGELAPFAESPVCEKIMAILDTRVVQIIFGDNANLTASAAKAIGALRRSTLRDEPLAAELCGRLEQFIAKQETGYRQLYDEKSGLFAFGWNATLDRFSGWEDGGGNWITGRMNYLVNEFRGPLSFVVQRFGFPAEAVKKCGFKIKPYRMADGRDLYTLATWEGSAFQSLGLSLFMQELDAPGWRKTLENSVAIQLDFSARRNLPGFLSEAYSGNGVDYTGRIGIPDLAVTDLPRITDAPSLYTLGVAYEISPGAIEPFLSNHWETVRSLFTAHGPWEGFNASQQRAIEFQTTAHTLALILGGIGSSGENMRRYLTWQGIYSSGSVRDGLAEPVDLSSETVQWIPWSPVGDSVEASRQPHGIRLRSSAVRSGAVTVKPSQPVNLSNGALVIRYRSENPPVNAILTLDGGPQDFQNEIFLRFDATATEKEIRIPLPETPGLEGVNEMLLRFGDGTSAAQFDLTLLSVDFIPAP